MLPQNAIWYMPFSRTEKLSRKFLVMHQFYFLKEVLLDSQYSKYGLFVASDALCIKPAYSLSLLVNKISLSLSNSPSLSLLFTLHLSLCEFPSLFHSLQTSLFLSLSLSLSSIHSLSLSSLYLCECA